MTTFPCPANDGLCTTGDEVTVALVRGEIVVGGPNLIEAFFPEGIDIAAAHATPMETSLEEIFGGAEGSQDLRLLAGQSIAWFARSTELEQQSGVIATCTPCKHRWIVPVQSGATVA